MLRPVKHVHRRRNTLLTSTAIDLLSAFIRNDSKRQLPQSRGGQSTTVETHLGTQSFYNLIMACPDSQIVECHLGKSTVQKQLH